MKSEQEGLKPKILETFLRLSHPPSNPATPDFSKKSCRGPTDCWKEATQLQDFRGQGWFRV